jgi:hypothetical protein
MVMMLRAKAERTPAQRQLIKELADYDADTPDELRWRCMPCWQIWPTSTGSTNDGARVRRQYCTGRPVRGDRADAEPYRKPAAQPSKRIAKRKPKAKTRKWASPKAKAVSKKAHTIGKTRKRRPTKTK